MQNQHKCNIEKINQYDNELNNMTLKNLNYEKEFELLEEEIIKLRKEIHNNNNLNNNYINLENITTIEQEKNILNEKYEHMKKD